MIHLVMVYNNYSNAGFSQIIESVKYNTTLAITGAIRGSSRRVYYSNLGFEGKMIIYWSYASTSIQDPSIIQEELNY